MTAAPAASPLSPASVRRVTWLDLIAIAVVTFAVFTPVLRTAFSPLDDSLMIGNNPRVTEATWESFKSFWAEPSFRIYMPIPLSLWQAVATLTHVGTPGAGDYGLSPVPFKVVSVLAHALAAAAAGWTLSTLTRTRWPAVAGALVFAMHPLQVESVAWTTGLKDELCGLLSILCVGLYARHAERNPPTPWPDGWWWAALASAILAMLCKPTAMVLPAVLLIVDWAVRRTGGVRRFVSVAPFVLPMALCATVAAIAQAGAPVPTIALALRPLVALDSYAFYLAKLVWPANLAVDYGRQPVLAIASGAVYWTWLLPAAVLVAVLLMRSRCWVLAAVLFAVPVLPVSGIVPFDMQQYSTVTDHYMYQPLLGVGLAVAMLLASRPRSDVLAIAAVGVVCVLSVTTWRTATRWGRFDDFYRHAMAINPHSKLARTMLGRLATDRGDLVSLRRYVNEALAANPDDQGTLENQAILAFEVGRYREAADVSLRVSNIRTARRLNLARRMTMLGLHLHDRDVAEAGLRIWVEVEPKNRYPIGMLQAVLLSKAQDARAAAATRP